MIETIAFKLNGQSVKLRVDGDRLLLWVLRTDLGITGTKYGCGKRLCGACTVLVNRKAVEACSTPVRSVDGAEVITIEGLAEDGPLHPLQQAFIEHNALQCGFCTPGMVLKAYDLLSENSDPSREDIISGMEHHLCRCGAHVRIIDAILAAAKEMKGGMR
jgi:aerobic-type carbon monoxide dehydrogenase small subunit (CoxS/CutS family)